MNIKEKIKQNFYNLHGWRTTRKIVVLESDDWGAARMSSKIALERLKRTGLEVERCHYMYNDSLASEEDLSMLFETLQKFKDSHGNHPIITANCLLANPDFEKIRKNDFQEYYYETFDQTLKRYSMHENALALWFQGMQESLFHPQIHGREHLNISRWMRDLRNKVSETHIAFDLEIYGISGHISSVKRGSYMAALDGGSQELIYDRSEILKDASHLFERIFGYISKSFIAPNYVWDEVIEQCLADQGVRFLQGVSVQRIPKSPGEQLETKRHYQGQKNENGQYYLMRNAHFEPASNPQKDWIRSCLKEIEIAFHWKKPAVIALHRVNFIGFIHPANRDRNLSMFKKLLKQIITKWPEVEFLTSDQLGEAISEKDA